MTEDQFKTLKRLLSEGKAYQADIPEGFIRIWMENGVYRRHEYQTNPYGGETRDRSLEMSEDELKLYFTGYPNLSAILAALEK